MQRASVLVLCIALGCYSDPDYGRTHFKCDSMHICPDGQLCIAGYCSGTSDAISSGPGVACGMMTCAGGQKCCVDLTDGAVSCISSGATCFGIEATCDGIEDCAGIQCCDDGNGHIACQATPCGGTQICRDNADCLNPNTPMCCLSIVPREPWGRCEPNC